MAAPTRVPRHLQASWQQGEELTAGEAAQPVSAQARDHPAAAITHIDGSSEDSLVAPPPACPACLDPILPEGPPHRLRAHWPGCEHPYHLACLARVRARMHPPTCALCRRPWPAHEDDALSHACNNLRINPYQDSEVESLPPPAAPAPAEAPPVQPWRHRGPPSHPVDTPYNSWLYCPLLHAATGDMPDAIVAQWHAAAPWWTRARQHLAAAPPVPAPTLQTALVDSTASGAPTLAARLAAATQPFPHGTELHLGWVVRTLQDPDGYIPAAGQEIVLQLFGGIRFAAELAAQADTFRARRQSPPRPRPSRRSGRGRGRGSHPAPPATLPPPEVLPPSRPDPPHNPEPTSAAVSAGLASLDSVDLAATFQERVFTFQQPPRQLQGLLAFAFRKGLQTLHHAPSDVHAERGWKLFLLGPRMLLYRPRGAAQVPDELRRRAQNFQAGRWLQLLTEAAQAAATTAGPSSPPPPPHNRSTVCQGCHPCPAT